MFGVRADAEHVPDARDWFLLPYAPPDVAVSQRVFRNVIPPCSNFSVTKLVRPSCVGTNASCVEILCGDGRIRPSREGEAERRVKQSRCKTCLYANPKNASRARLPEACQIFTASNKITVP